MQVKLAKTCLPVLLCFPMSGCWEKPVQFVEEQNCAGFVLSRLQSYESQFPNIPMTNLQQVLTANGMPYPAHWHHRLRSFGKHAGFKNSLFEKYAFVPTQFSNDVIQAEIVLLNAEPFPDRDGKYGRVIFSKWKQGWDGWMFKWYPEDQVQEFFRAAGQNIPKAAPMPPPFDLAPPYQPSLRARATRYFEDITIGLGLGPALGRYLMWAVLGLVVIGGSVACWLSFRKWR